jgi:hypothetical protein
MASSGNAGPANDPKKRLSGIIARHAMGWIQEAGSVLTQQLPMQQGHQSINLLTLEAATKSSSSSTW